MINETNKFNTVAVLAFVTVTKDLKEGKIYFGLGFNSFSPWKNRGKLHGSQEAKEGIIKERKYIVPRPLVQHLLFTSRLLLLFLLLTSSSMKLQFHN